MTTFPSRQSDLSLAREAALEAGRIVLAYFGAAGEVRYKSVDQPVTIADVEADGVLKHMLQGPRPEYGWLSEESADSPDRLGRERVWVVDPIDGTNSFIEARPEFVVSIGLVERGVPVIAVVYNPATAEMYHAETGAGAFLNDGRIRVAPAPADGERGVLLASRNEIRRGDFDSVGDRWEVVPLGSTAYRMVKVADGTGHAFVSSAAKNEWDVCGAHLVLAEAGGAVRQWDGQEPTYNRADASFRGVVCASPSLLDLLLPPDGRAAPFGLG